MRTLIHFSSHIRDGAAAALLTAQFNLCRHLNPEADICVIDSASPIDPRSFLNGRWSTGRLVDDADTPRIPAGNTLIRFKDALGHPHHDGLKFRSGPCRAWMKGIELAIRNGYDCVVYYEYDLFNSKSVAWMLGQMQKPVGTGGPIMLEPFDEVGIFVADVEYLWRSNFIEQYNWQGPTKPLGEVRMISILGNDRQVLPIKCNRDRWVTSPDDFHLSYPEGLDAITHAKPETMHHFLRLHGLERCWLGDVPPATAAAPGAPYHIDPAQMMGAYDNALLVQ